MKRSIYALLMVIVGLAVTASDASATGRVRLVHALMEAPAVTVWVDSLEPAAVPVISFPQASASIEVAAGSHHLTVGLAGAPIGNAIYDTVITVADDSLYTFFVLGSATGGLRLVSTVDAVVGTIPPQSAEVRLLNGVAQLPALEVVWNAGAETFTDPSIPFGGTGDWHTVQAGDVTIDLAVPGMPVFDKEKSYLQPGWRATILTTGTYAEGELGGFFVLMMVDNDTNEQNPLVALTRLPLEHGSLRFVHVAPGLGDLYLLRNSDAGDSTPIGYRFASAVRDDLLGEQLFLVGRIGVGMVGAAAAVITPDSTQTVIIYGEGDTNEISTLTISSPEMLPHGERTTLIRVVNAVPDIPAIDVEMTPMGDTSTTPAFSNIPFGSATPFDSIVGGVDQVRVSRTGQSSPFITFGSGIPQGVVATLIINGRDTANGIVANLLIESNTLEQEPMIFLAPLASGGVGMRLATTTILPNPTRDVARVLLPSSDGGRIVVIDMLGRELFALEFAAGAEGRQLRLPIEELSAGNYRVVVTGTDGVARSAGNLVVTR